MDSCRLVILISGSGNNLQAIIDACMTGQIKGKIVAVISNRPDAYGLERARRAGIPHHILDHKTFQDRESFDQALIELIDSYTPNLLLLAGFMRILTNEFTRCYAGKMLNIHPSRLPDYRGLQTHQRVLEAGEKLHGASIHFVTDELDGGPVVLQSKVPVRMDHTEEILAAEILATELIIYPLAVQWYCESRLQMDGVTVLFNGRILSSPIQLDEIEAVLSSADENSG